MRDCPKNMKSPKDMDRWSGKDGSGFLYKPGNCPFLCEGLKEGTEQLKSVGCRESTDLLKMRRKK